MSDLRPLTLKREGNETLVIEWSDGHRGVLPWIHLRKNCPCATCREEQAKPPDPFRLLTDREMASGPLRAVSVSPVGHYAYKITWSDGHDTGIYTCESLRTLCRCAECAKS